MIKGLLCPECKSEALRLAGKMASGRKYKQRWICNKCLRTTVAPIDKSTGKPTCTTIPLTGGVI